MTVTARTPRANISARAATLRPAHLRDDGRCGEVGVTHAPAAAVAADDADDADAKDNDGEDNDDVPTLLSAACADVAWCDCRRLCVSARISAADDDDDDDEARCIRCEGGTLAPLLISASMRPTQPRTCGG